MCYKKIAVFQKGTWVKKLKPNKPKHHGNQNMSEHDC